MKRVIVTGATGLIGKEVSSFLEKNSYKVIRCSKSLGYDLTDELVVKKFFDENPAEYLVNLYALNQHVEENALSSDGHQMNPKGNDIYDISLDSINEYLNINVTSLFSVCREFARVNKTGVIVNFSSIYGVVSPDPSMYGSDNKHIGYPISKCAVRQLSKYLAVNLSPNIRVNCVIPGGVKDSQSESFTKKYNERVPIGRMMNVDELNGIIKYLCSDESSYCVGGEFLLDGGYTAW